MGKHVFKGDIASPYLVNQGLEANTMESSDWVKDKATVDKVAQAILSWARDNGGFAYCHWFQPLGKNYVYLLIYIYVLIYFE